MVELCVTLILCRKFKISRIPNGVRRMHSTPEESRVESRFLTYLSIFQRQPAGVGFLIIIHIMNQSNNFKGKEG